MAEPGDKVMIRLDGFEYPTIIDDQGVQRFYKNEVVDHLFEAGRLDLNKLALEFRQGKFSLRHYAEFYMSLGYSVSGFMDLSAFSEMKIENPLWYVVMHPHAAAEIYEKIG